MVELEVVKAIVNKLDAGEFNKKFKLDDVKICKNPQTNWVYVTNKEEQVLILLGDKLFMYYYSPYSKLEGTYEELADEYETMTEKEREWFSKLEQD